jgi:hypothetical protein
MRAMSAISHFSMTSGNGGVVCQRCHKPLNRWDEKCEYETTTETMLAEDILFLLGELEGNKTRHVCSCPQAGLDPMCPQHGSFAGDPTGGNSGY